jgi:mevalonate kinase
LRKVLRSACRDNGDFLSQWKKYIVETKLEFPRNWGLGSSSTLVYLISEWAEANPFLVLFDSFEGSGYDVACAGADGPILYQLSEDALHYESCDFNPPFQDQLYFVHLGEKADSQEAVKKYLKGKKPSSATIDRISQLTQSMADEKDFKKFEKQLDEHNSIMADILPLEPPSQTHFSDFWGKVKPLGAWGGDFVMVTSDRSSKETKDYFNDKGFSVFLPYKEIIY